MALSAFVGSFTVPAATGNKAVTGVGFQPKVLIFWGNGRTSDANGGTAGTSTTMSDYRGIAVSTSSRVVMGTSDNFNTGSNFVDATKCIKSINGASTKFAADFISFDADGFTVNFTTAIATAYVVNFLALGGSDLSNVFLKSYTTPTSTGNNAQTGVGFQPDAVMVFGEDTSITDSTSIGVATSTSARGAIGSSFGPTVYTRTDKVVVYNPASGTTVRRQADFVSFDSDGFTFNWDTVNAATSTVYVLCLKGGQYKAGNFTQPGATGSQGYTGAGFTPKGMFLLSAGKTNGSTISGLENMHMMGAASGASNRAVQFFGSDGFGIDALDRANVLKTLNDDSTGTVSAAADLTSFDSDGFTLNFGTADATAREHHCLLFGDAGGGGGGPTLSRARFLPLLGAS